MKVQSNTELQKSRLQEQTPTMKSLHLRADSHESAQESATDSAIDASKSVSDSKSQALTGDDHPLSCETSPGGSVLTDDTSYSYPPSATEARQQGNDDSTMGKIYSYLPSFRRYSTTSTKGYIRPIATEIVESVQSPSASSQSDHENDDGFQNVIQSQENSYDMLQNAQEIKDEQDQYRLKDRLGLLPEEKILTGQLRYTSPVETSEVRLVCKGSLYRIIPVRGRIVVTQNYLGFYSSYLKTVTKVC